MRFGKWYYLLAVAILIAAGLGVRDFAASLPVFVAEHFGDALWAAMIYCGLRFLLHKASPAMTAWVSVFFCFGIEFSQLYQAEWIVALRHTGLGALVLGQGFLFLDLIRYSAGIAVLYLLDRHIASRIRTAKAHSH